MSRPDHVAVVVDTEGEGSHSLIVTTEWARSHSGQNYAGRCSCGHWKMTVGGGLADYRALLRKEHDIHVAKTGN